MDPWPRVSADGPRPLAALEEGLDFLAAEWYKKRQTDLELVRVYEKIRCGIWGHNGRFRLVDAWLESSNTRQVFRFELEMIEDVSGQVATYNTLEHDRVIPTSVKLEVWSDDKGRCVQSGSTDNLHFDHIMPYSLGGSSLVSEDIQLLCARHNIAKKDRIE